MLGFPRRPKILVPDGVLSDGARDYALLQAVVAYVNRMRDEGCYRDEDLPAPALQVYAADYYYAQVCNGGHQQFAHNSRMGKATVDLAIAGLEAARLEPLAKCLRDLRDSQGEAADGLDDRFFAAYGTYYAAMNAWLRPHLRAVAAAAYPDAMTALLRRDARRQRRFEDLAALRNQALSEDSFRVGLARAALLRGSPLQRVLNGSLTDVLGRTTPAFGIELADGRRAFGLEVEGAVFLTTERPPPQVTGLAEWEALLATSSVAMADEVAADVACARDQRAGATVTLLLFKARLSAEFVSIARIPEGRTPIPEGSCLFVAQAQDGRTYTLAMNGAAAVLSILQKGDAPNRVLATERHENVRRALRALENRIGA